MEDLADVKAFLGDGGVVREAHRSRFHVTIRNHLLKKCFGFWFRKQNGKIYNTSCHANVLGNEKEATREIS